MHTARLSTVLASIATRCQHLVGGPQVKKFEQASSLGHQMLPPDAPCTVRRSHVGGGGLGIKLGMGGKAGVSLYNGEVPCRGRGVWESSWGWEARQGCPSTTVRSHVGCRVGARGFLYCTMRSHIWGGSLYGDVQSIIGNSNMGHPPGQNDWQTRLKYYLPATSLPGGKDDCKND